MPNVTRGHSMRGLLAYLAGPGRANEHTDPHLVAGDPAVMAWHDDAVLDQATAATIADTLDAPRRTFDVEVPRGPVWHCSLSLAAAEGELTDEAWAEIATEFVEGLGFAGEGRAPCRWVAVRHGRSAAGNDHVHLAVSLVREDGTKASTWQDYPRAQRLAGELERRHGLVVLESRAAGRGERGIKPAEVRRAAAAGRVEPDRVTLERTVRAAAASASDEAEMVRRLRREGLLVRARYAAGRDDVVAGYSVALRPPRGMAPAWYGGGHLARDLTLPRLRDGWPDTPEHAAAAVAEWTAARRGRPPVAPGVEVAQASTDPAVWERAARDVQELREALAVVPFDDVATWSHVAQDVAGVFAAWSRAVEPTPGPLAAASRAVARSAQVRAGRAAGAPAYTPKVAVRSAALLLASAHHGGRGPVARAVLLRQLARTAVALHDAHAAAGEAQRAGELAAVLRGELVAVRASLTPAPAGPAVDAQAVEAVRLARTGLAPVRAPGSPVPARLDRPRTTTAPSSSRDGVER